MGHSEAFVALLASTFVASCAAMPTTAPELSVNLTSLDSACGAASADACLWVGIRAAARSDVAKAESTFGWLCSQGNAAGCASLYRLATAPGPLPNENRGRALDLLCKRGVVEACETLIQQAEKDPSSAAKRYTVSLLKSGCDKADDGASCARLGAVYDTAAVADVRVLARRDPSGAVDSYGRACAALVRRYPWDPPEHHVDEARAVAATALEATSCEKLGDHYFSGDGVRVDPLVAVDAYRNCPTPGCAKKRDELRQLARVQAHDDEAAEKEEGDRREATAQHEAQVEQEREAKAQKEEAERQAAQAEREAQAESDRAALAAGLQGLQAGMAGLAAAQQRLPPPTVAANGVALQAKLNANTHAAALATASATRARATAASVRRFEASAPQPSSVRVATPAGTLNTTGSPASSVQQTQPASGTQADLQRQAYLHSCLAAAPGCGGSNGCAPSVPYTDRFGGRRTIRLAHVAAQQCSAAEGSWAPQCYQPKVRPLLATADIQGLASKVEDVQKRALLLPAEVSAGMPTCSANPEDVRQLDFWCANLQADCLTHTDDAVPELDCARQIDQFLYTAEPQARRLATNREYENQCHLQYGY